MNRATILLTAMALPLTLSACATGRDSYPSLAKREGERFIGTGQPVEAPDTPPAPPPAADLQARLAQLVADARDAHQTFVSLRPSAERIISSGGSSARLSDPWISAQVALADLDGARSRTFISLAELDKLYVEERIAYPGQVTPSASAIAGARDEVESLAQQEDAVIARLRGQLGS